MLLAATLMLGAAVPVLKAEELLVDLDDAKTQVTFTLSDVLHTVHGRFLLKRGHFSFDPSTSVMSGNIVVDAASGDSGSQARDKRMTHDILEAQRFPEIRFAPSNKAGSVAPSGPSDVEVTGPFLIHGQAHSMTIPMHIQMSGTDVIATGKFVVPYVAWGMKNPSNFFLKVSDKVEIDLTAVGHIRRGEVARP